MPLDHGSLVRLFTVSSTLFNIIGGEYTKEIPFPTHVVNVENSLLWAVKVKDGTKSEGRIVDQSIVKIPDKNGLARNCKDSGMSCNLKNSPTNSLAEEVARDCKLLYVDDVEVVPNTHLLGFDIDKLHHFESRFDINSSSSFELNRNTLHIKLLHGLYVKHIPYPSFQLISDQLSQCLDSHPVVEWYSQQNVRSRTKRDINHNFSDPYFNLQWHLVSFFFGKMQSEIVS